MSPLAWTAFVVAGAAGAAARHLLGQAMTERSAGRFPWGTLVVNVTGSFLFGVVTGLALDHGLAREPRIVVGTGFCGAYTTFSTFTYETIRLVEDGAVKDALRNAATTVVAAAVATAAGLGLAAL
ncbi:MAG TPA: fluoride efflux transporter CrcB [Acidimicrobiia bacterium]|nr:fluoride efflux transporter CrcB [Acidimicrobiia bacterium]